MGVLSDRFINISAGIFFFIDFLFLFYNYITLINDDNSLRKSQKISFMIFLLIFFLQFLLYLFIYLFIFIYLCFLFIYLFIHLFS